MSIMFFDLYLTIYLLHLSCDIYIYKIVRLCIIIVYLQCYYKMTEPVTKVNAKCDIFYIQWPTCQEGFTERINKL
jgi:hypothetical protein